MDLYTLADIERRFKYEPSGQHTVARNRLKALRPALERRGWLARIQPANALAVKAEGLALFTRLQKLMDDGLSERDAAAKVLEEIGDKEAPPAIDTGSAREVIGELARVLERLAELRADMRQQEGRLMGLSSEVAALKDGADTLAETVAEQGGLLSQMRSSWCWKLFSRLALPRKSG